MGLLVPAGLERSDRFHDFVCGHDGVRVVGNIDVESSEHLFIRIIGRRVSYHGDVVAKLSG